MLSAMKLCYFLINEIKKYIFLVMTEICKARSHKSKIQILINRQNEIQYL